MSFPADRGSWRPAAVAAALLLWCGAHYSPAQALRVCADPNNLPFSNRAGQGFENHIAELMAHDLGVPLRYTWWPQRRGFVRRTLVDGQCDVVLGLPAGYPGVALTPPYYRSSWVFVTRRDRNLHLHSFDDPRLRHLTIGLHAIGAGYASTPPAVELARRGIVGRIVGYSIYGNYSSPDPPADLLRGVARGEVDVAIAWGPLAGFFASRNAGVPLALDAIAVGSGSDTQALTYDIAAATRAGDTATRAMLEGELRRRRPEIRRLLRDYGVPLEGMDVAPGEQP